MPIQQSTFVILDWREPVPHRHAGDPFFRAENVIRNRVSGDKEWIPDLPLDLVQSPSEMTWGGDGIPAAY
jgi:hypothetical protein